MVDKAKHSAKPRVITVRLLVIGLIAVSLTGKDPTLKRVAAAYCSHRRTKSRKHRVLRKRTLTEHLGVDKFHYASYANVQHTLAKLGEKLPNEVEIIGDDGEPVLDALLNWIGIDLPQASIRASGDADLYAASRSVAVDTTILPSFANHAPVIDNETGEILRPAYDNTVRYNHKTETNRGYGGEIASYQMEAFIPLRTLQPHEDRYADDIEPLPGTASAVRFHNEKHNGLEIGAGLRQLAARGIRNNLIVADRGISQSEASKWAADLRSQGIEPVHDLRENQRGVRPLIHTFSDPATGLPASSLSSVDGTLFEAHIVNHLETLDLVDLPRTEWVVKAKSRDERNGNTEAQDARRDNINRYDQRDALAWRAHDRQGPWTGRYRGPAHPANATAWCINWKRSHKHQHRLPKTPCTTGDACNCGDLITITLDPTEPAHEQWNKIRQRIHWGTRRWTSLYSHGRNLSESGFAGPRGNFTNHAAPLVKHRPAHNGPHAAQHPITPAST